MHTALRERLTYANLMSTLAVFLVIGGGAAMAAGLGRDSVKSKQIKDGKVKTKDLANDAATGAKVAEGTLGTVPSASDATTLGGKTTADLAGSSAFDQDASVINPLPAAETNVAQATIATQSTGRVLASGVVEFAGNGRVQCHIDIGGPDSLAYESASTGNEFVVAAEFARNNLPAGAHTATLICRTVSGTIAKDDAAINVSGIPTP